jgi:hypothetical protein
LASGQTRSINLDVTYSAGGSATGSISVRGPHPGVTITAWTVLACPTSHPWSGGVPAPECASEYSGPGGFGYGAADRNAVQGQAKSGSPHTPGGFNGQPLSGSQDRYLLSLTPGSWYLYPGYLTDFGSVTDHTGTVVQITPNGVTNQDLSMAYQPPTQGKVTGTVSVTGAQPSDFGSGVQACTAAPTGTTCTGEQDAFSQPDGSYTMLLTPGTWWLRGFVDVYFGLSVTQSTSNAVVVDVAAGKVSKENFTVTAPP